MNTWKTETIKRLGKTITLICDENGFWGWTIGSYTKYPTFKYQSIAIRTAIKHIKGQ